MAPVWQGEPRGAWGSEPNFPCYEPPGRWVTEAYNSPGLNGPGPLQDWKFSESLFGWPSTLRRAASGGRCEICLQWQKLRNASPSLLCRPGPDTHVHVLTHPDTDLCAGMHAYMHRCVCSHRHMHTDAGAQVPIQPESDSPASVWPQSTLPAALR